MKILLPASIKPNHREYLLVITKRKIDNHYVIKYERADGSGRIWQYTEDEDLQKAELAMRHILFEHMIFEYDDVK